jgi:hypothetical protein
MMSGWGGNERKKVFFSEVLQNWLHVQGFRGSEVFGFLAQVFGFGRCFDVFCYQKTPKNLTTNMSKSWCCCTLTDWLRNGDPKYPTCVGGCPLEHWIWEVNTFLLRERSRFKSGLLWEYFLVFLLSASSLNDGRSCEICSQPIWMIRIPQWNTVIWS